jgi:hypothetical protein
MKKLFYISWLFVSILLYSQQLKAQTPITDTIDATSYEEAINLTFGLLPKSHYPSGYLFNKAATIPKMTYANGLLNDSSFNMAEFYFIQNSIRMSYNYPDSIKGYFYLDSIKNKYIAQNNILPWGVVDVTGQLIRDSAFVDGSLSASNHRIIENTTNLNKLYTTIKRFCVAPLNMEIYTLNPQFIIKPEYMFSNNTHSITNIQVDLDDGLGYKNISINTSFQASYNSGGYKLFITRIIYNNGDTLYSRSELNIIDNSLAKISSNYEPYDEVYTIYAGGGNGEYPSEFSPHLQSDRYAEFGIWYGCGNLAKQLRKPIVIFGGYNPKDGKSLEASGNNTWINANLGSLLSLDGWRGPLYETYDGYFTDASKNASGGQAFGSNGNRFLDKLRQEGYDVIIVRFWDGIGYLQTSAFLATLVLKDINNKILTITSNVTNPGADLDPEAPGYPITTKIKAAKHELVVAGFSAGALGSRLGLLLMEYEHEKYKCSIGTQEKFQSKVHRVKTWIGFDQEAQGSNLPIGLQMFWDFEKSLWNHPSNAADLMNSLICWGALDLANKQGVARQNTLYHFNNMFRVGPDSWDVGHHSDFDDYFADLERITPANYPANLKGYPKNCYRIGISQGSANGVKQLIGSTTDLIYNQSPSTWCVGLYSDAPGGLSPFTVTPFREATARVLSSWNDDAFDCKFGVAIKTFFYNWYVNLGHWTYKPKNHIIDRYVGTHQAYDEAPASTLPSQILTGKAMFGHIDATTAAFGDCNLRHWNDYQHGFSPTVSSLDLRLPGNDNLPRLPNLTIVPGNVSGGLNLMQQNKYNLGSNNSPNKDFGYPHLTFPTNHYDYTPYDAVWANTRNDVNYDDNTIHIEDPNSNIGEFLVEEIAPYTLYLSNRTIAGDVYNCGTQHFVEKYYADFEARNSILAGDQSIYQHNVPYYQRTRTSPGDFVVDDAAVVTMRANNADGQSAVTLGAGFSAKAGSIFRAYVFNDPNMCSPFSYRQGNPTASAPPAPTKQARPIATKRMNTQKTGAESKNINIALFPNPTNGSINYLINKNEEYTYSISDVMGKILQSGTFADKVNSINLTTFDKGIYIITVSNKEFSQTDRIILQ